MRKNIIIVGGRTSGLMAAISAASSGAHVTLIEKGPRLGYKISISGGGRCNVTNNKPANELIQHMPGNGRFLHSAFSIFNSADIINFFESRGVPLKEEDHGRMFPVSDKSEDIVNTLVDELKKYRVEVLLNTSVKKVMHRDGQITGVKLITGDILKADAVIIAVGGKSLPKSGSTGDGYAWARDCGHTITHLFPTEVALTSNEPFIQSKALQGLSLPDINLSVLNQKGKVAVSHQMDMIFTHFGISGPAALRCSSFVYNLKRKENRDAVTLALDAFPTLSFSEATLKIKTTLANAREKSIKNSLKPLLPERYLNFLLDKLDIDITRPANSMREADIEKLAHLIKNFTFTVNGTLPLEKAFVTGGGVNLKEINPKTMASKLTAGLYFCGEILDIHGYTGGYNITAAFATGFVAGQAAATT